MGGWLASHATDFLRESLFCLHPAWERGLSAPQQFTGKRQSGSCSADCTGVTFLFPVNRCSAKWGCASRFAWKPVSPASGSAFYMLLYRVFRREKNWWTVTKLKSDFTISDDEVEKIFEAAKEKARPGTHSLRTLIKISYRLRVICMLVFLLSRSTTGKKATRKLQAARSGSTDHSKTARPRNVCQPIATKPIKYAIPVKWMSRWQEAYTCFLRSHNQATKGTACRAWKPIPWSQMIFPCCPTNRPALNEIQTPAAKESMIAIMA